MGSIAAWRSPLLLAGMLLAAGACEVVFDAGGLSRGTTGGNGSGGQTTTSSSSGRPEVCSKNEQCDDGDPCTANVCDHGACKNALLPADTVCAAAHGCIPASKCDAKGSCVAAAPDDSACDDDLACTRDVCLPSGVCQNKALPTSSPCVAMDGTCGFCDGTTCRPGKDAVICANATPPPDQFLVSYGCFQDCPNPDSCATYCTNGSSYRHPCTDTISACCPLASTASGVDCNAACPTGYALMTGTQKSDPSCGCGNDKLQSVTCTRIGN